MRAQCYCPGRALADEYTAALARDNQTFIAQDADGLLDRHPGHAVAAGQLIT
jgi:hypothetical protein